MSVDHLISALSAYEEVILLSAMVSVLASAFLVYRTLLHRDPLADRIESINERQRALRQGMLAPKSRKRQHQSVSAMRSLVESLKLHRSREADRVKTQLTRAGLRHKDALIFYYFTKLCLPVVLAATAAFLIYVMQIFDMQGPSRLFLVLAAAAAGAYLPNVYVKNCATKRQQALRKGVPDALDLLVICAEAGQSMDGAIKRVAAEAGLFCPELAEELGLTAVELGLMPDRRQALDNLVNRTDVAELRNVVNALLQTEKYGTPLAHSLRVLAAEYRQDRLTRAEEKAARLPAIMTVPMIIFILPPLFVVLVGPAALKILDALMRL